MIREAIAVTRFFWPVPPIGMVTFIDREKVKPINRRRKKHWGYSYERAGFEPDGETKGGLLAFLLRPANFPEPKPPFSLQRDLLFNLES